jgi:hypothetical protein
MFELYTVLGNQIKFTPHQCVQWLLDEFPEPYRKYNARECIIRDIPIHYRELFFRLAGEKNIGLLHDDEVLKQVLKKLKIKLRFSSWRSKRLSELRTAFDDIFLDGRLSAEEINALKATQCFGGSTFSGRGAFEDLHPWCLMRDSYHRIQCNITHGRDRFKNVHCIYKLSGLYCLIIKADSQSWDQSKTIKFKTFDELLNYNKPKPMTEIQILDGSNLALASTSVTTDGWVQMTFTRCTNKINDINDSSK